MKKYSIPILLMISPLAVTAYMSYQKGAMKNNIQYPMQQSDIDSLGENKMRQGYTLDDKRVKIDNTWLEKNKGPQQGSKEFEAEMLITAYAVTLAKNEVPLDTLKTRPLLEVSGLDANQPYISDVLSKYNVSTAGDLARLVHKDRPTQIIDDALEWLSERGAKRREGLLNETTFGNQFTETVVCDEALAAGMVLHTSYSAFAAKYYYGFPRPEEVFSAFVRGEYSPVTSNLSKALDSMLSKDIGDSPEVFTLYPEGAPNHPSRPAMHSSVASILYMLNVLYELDEYETDQILRLQSNLAFGRTLAGVHRPYDNINGINLGIYVMKNGLMKELLDMSGVDYNQDILQKALEEKMVTVGYFF